MKTRIQKYQIVNCLGEGNYGIVSLRIPAEAFACDYEQKAMKKSGVENYICESCYDDKYHAKPIFS